MDLLNFIYDNASLRSIFVILFLFGMYLLVRGGGEIGD